MLPNPDFRALIEQKAAWPVEQFLHGRANGEKPTLQIKRFIEGIISADYHGRTLIELIQNAHDAHTKGSSTGRISILLDETEGKFGTLYVANGGHPLSRANFNAMIAVALSDKPPSEGIGNKGVGFKSVLQFSDAPEVYSKSSAGAADFDGFTFRFGRIDDFERLADSIDAEPGELAEHISTLTLTFPLESAPERVATLGTDGFCTVIRLPLKSQRARDDALDELDAVSGSDVPMHLFLDRIETIETLIVGEDAPDALTLTRLVDDLDTALDVTTSMLQDDSEFVVARRTVPEGRVLEAIQATREAGAHLPGWDAWKGDAAVVLALSAGEPLASPRLYNFLPMGEQVGCPLPAYVQAPFFSSLDRRSLDASYPINALFLDEVAELAADLLVAAVDGDLDLADGTLVDLACWSSSHLARLQRATAVRDRPLDGMAILPSLVPGTRVSTIQASLWVPTGPRFSPARLEERQLRSLIDPGLAGMRMTRVTQLVTALGHHATWLPSREMLVAFAETCAASLLRDEVKPKAWAKFYDELAVALPGQASLAGARIVIGPDRLLAANGSQNQPTVFFPPASGDVAARRQPPSAVAGRLAYVRDDIPWKTREGNRPGKEWLGGLVAEFGTEDILKVVAEVMAGAALDDESLAQTLHYALDVWRQARSPLGEESFPSTAFRVPTASGWIPAAGAYFGRGWGGQEEWVDDALARLLRQAGDVAELHDISAAVVLSPDSWIDDASLHELMRTFLERAGVRHGLWPIEVPRTLWRLQGVTLNSPAVIDPGSLPDWVPDKIREPWLRAADALMRAPAVTRFQDYSLVRNQMLPGQFSWSDLPASLRDVYGELVLAGLDRWDDEALEAWFHRRETPDSSWWPSFVTTFLVSEAWFPQREPGDRMTPGFARLTDAWWVSEELPPYLPSAATHLRREIGATAVGRMRRWGLRHWDAPDGAVDRIDHLVNLIATEGHWIPGTRAAYDRSWEQHLSLGQDRESARQPGGVLVERGSHVEAADLSAEGETVYFAVPDLPQGSLLAHVPLARLGFTNRQLSKRVGDFLASSVSDRFRSVADAEIEVVHSNPTATGMVLDVVGDWLETFILLVLSHQQGIARWSDRQLAEATHRLRETTLALVETFTTTVDGHDVGDETKHASCYVEQPGGTGLVLVRGGSGLSRIALAELAAEGLCQAIGAPGAVRDLRLALLDLNKATGGGTPSLSDLAEALGLRLADAELASAERGALRPDISFLVAVLATLVPELAEELRDSSLGEDRQDLEVWLTARLGDANAEALTLMAYADRGRVQGPIEDELVSLPDANRGLTLLGMEPLSNAEAHLRAFNAFVSAQRPALLNELRDRFAQRVADEPDAVAIYAELTEFPQLTVHPAWANEFWHLPPEAMVSRTSTWLLEVAGPPSASGLPSVDALRARPLTQSLTTARDSVLTWCAMKEVDTPDPIEVASVSALIRTSGFLDFAERTPEEIVSWLHEHGYWPEAMPRTLSRRDLGISDKDLRRERERKREAVAAEKRRKSAIEYGGETFTGESDDLLRLAEAIAHQVSVVPLVASPTLAELSELPARQPRDRSGSKNPPVRASSPPPEKIQNIGLAGELFAAHWIETKFGLAREETWRSGYRNDILGGRDGDDSLGYDFSVPMGDVTHLIEVKATTGTDTIFSLPEVEIACALGLKPHEDYTILFIANVLDDALRTFTWLPNPLGSQARLFRREGREMKFRFDVAD